MDVVSTILGSAVGLDEPLMAAGLDSLGAVELKGAIEKVMGLDLPATFVFNYPTVSSMVQFCVEASPMQHDEGVDAAPAFAGGLSHARHAEGPVVCDVGAILVPVELDSFAADSGASCDTVRAAPPERWSTAAGDGDLQRFCSFLDGVELFDNSLFKISQQESTTMDPQQRILLEQVAKSSPTASQNCGVFVGVTYNGYSDEISAFSELSVNSAAGGSSSVACGRTSFLFDLQGPCISVDTACSSSLAATHFAKGSLQMGDAEQAFACGVVVLTQTTTAPLQRAGMLAPDGRCKTLSAAADGYGRSEACCVLKLGNGVNAPGFVGSVLLGSSTNQDGRSSSLSAPNGVSQKSVILMAREQGASGERVRTVEMHGTGTALGDPIEVGALSSIEADRATDDAALRLICVKSVVGHGEVVSGLLGASHALFATAACTRKKIQHLRGLNPYVGDIFSSAGMRANVSASRQLAPAGAASGAAGVSSFAFQGTNVHTIVAGSLAGRVAERPPPELSRTRHSFLPLRSALYERVLGSYEGTLYFSCLLDVTLMRGGAVGGQVCLVPSGFQVPIFQSMIHLTRSGGKVGGGARSKAACSAFAVCDLVANPIFALGQSSLHNASFTCAVNPGGQLETSLIVGGDSQSSAGVCAQARVSGLWTSSRVAPRPAGDAPLVLSQGGCLKQGVARLAAPRDHIDSEYRIHPARLEALSQLLPGAPDRAPATLCASAVFAADDAPRLSSDLFACLCGGSTRGGSSATLASVSGRTVAGARGMLWRSQDAESAGGTAMFQLTASAAPSAATSGKAAPAGVCKTLQEVEDIVRKAAEDVIEDDSLALDDNLLDAGLDSLSAIEFRAKLEQAFGVQLPGTLVSDHPSIKCIAELLREDPGHDARYLPPLFDGTLGLRRLPPVLPRWYRALMAPSKMIFRQFKYGKKRALGAGVSFVQPSRGAVPKTQAACSTVDINVAWTQMRATYYFPSGINEQSLQRSLAKVLDAFPSLTGVLMEDRGDLYIEYGGEDAGVDFKVQSCQQWTPQDFIGQIIPGLWRLSVAAWLWQFFTSNLGVALIFAWRAYTALFGTSLFRVTVTHITRGERRRPQYPLFYTRYDNGVTRAQAEDLAPSSLDSGHDSGGSYLTLDWMHSVADGSTIGRVLSLWSAAHRGLPLLMHHPGPSDSLTEDQKKLVASMWLNESPVPRLYQTLPGTGLDYTRFLIPEEHISAVCAQAGGSVSDAAIALLWTGMVRVSAFGSKEGAPHPRITLLEDLRGTVPEFQPFSGNMLRFLPLLAPRIEDGIRRSGDRVFTGAEVEVSRALQAHRSATVFRLSDLEQQGKLGGIPCTWTALHDLVRRGEGPILCVNDLTHFDATLSFGGGMEGQMPAESMGWRPDIPVYSLDLVEDFARCPLWQAWLTRGPNGVVVSLFSMP